MSISLLLEMPVSNDPDQRGTGVHDMRVTVGELNASADGGAACSARRLFLLNQFGARDGSDPIADQEGGCLLRGVSVIAVFAADVSSAKEASMQSP